MELKLRLQVIQPLILQTTGTNYKGKIKYDITLSLFYVHVNSSTTATLAVTSDTATITNVIVSGNHTADKAICNKFEAVGIMDQINIKGNWVLFGNVITHTILASTVSQFCSLTSFTTGIQVQKRYRIRL